MSVSARLAIRTLFAPFDDTTAAFLAFVQTAQTSLDISIYGFHLPPLTDLLIAKHQAGMRISVILDHTQAEGKAEAGEVAKLVAAGVPVLIGTSPVHHQILHSKFTVVDGRAVQHGSWNYSLSAAAQSNDMHFVEDEAYAREYQRHHDRVRAFILLHEMMLQPQGEVAADAALPEDEDPHAAGVASTPQPSDETQPAASRAASAAPVSAAAPPLVAADSHGAPAGPTSIRVRAARPRLSRSSASNTSTASSNATSTGTHAPVRAAGRSQARVAHGQAVEGGHHGG